MSSTEPNASPDAETRMPRERRKFILCFDGTGNKFQGTGGDSNILKIYSMLDRTDKSQSAGIGTYRNTKSLSSSGPISRVSSWYSKAKDSAIGSTLDEHVMAGYRFLMRYYQDGDDIYFFGFSRGAYIARFLAEMLDHVGLLSAGNEELVRFVWKTFARWQQRHGGNSQAKEKTKELFHFMKAFRETFSRPVRRIRFLGLFDTVNSVSKFEGAWMQRSRFPYTARSSAITICHAVSIDERRAKFRQDLISQKVDRGVEGSLISLDYFRRRRNQARAHALAHGANGKTKEPNKDKEKDALTPGQASGADRFRSHSRDRSTSPHPSQNRTASTLSLGSSSSIDTDAAVDSEDEYENMAQQITEVWFAGCHADVGGGWTPDPPENLSLSHVPLVWMLRKAQEAGLAFNPDKMSELGCFYDDTVDDLAKSSAKNSKAARQPPIPSIELNDSLISSEDANTVSHQDEDDSLGDLDDDSVGMDAEKRENNRRFMQFLDQSCTRGRIHDVLRRNQGSPTGTVLTWNIMEFLPFRRMDLRPDGSWKAIRWPLPMGEVRDVPYDVKVHSSVIKRMKADENYRPGNLIMGGGGRGMRRAPAEAGMGEWVVLEEGKGHPIHEVWVRAKGEKSTTTLP
ncbi:hypothetical protein BP6252_05673 [Coleophoma cylindrospora]|uniref:T6SS Phospholipase effector Tle1-like catalytic domain-containing protein n=1 Tax=Coleophoma cylindrospora TaxID=1849047 RepID=A0A3D8RUJ0_9HELO|nr:hypothetical protein BP6252_05673 [Coleophoma cylindrospora]